MLLRWNKILLQVAPVIIDQRRPWHSFWIHDLFSGNLTGAQAETLYKPGLL